MKAQTAKQKGSKKDLNSKAEEYPKGKLVALIFLSCIGALFVMSALSAIGNGNAKGVGSVTIILGVIMAFMVVPNFLKKKTQKTIIFTAISAFLVLGSIIAIIADPIVVNNKCSKFTTLEEYNKAPLSETIECWGKKDELEAKEKAEKEEQRKSKKNETEQKKKECSAKGLDWNESEDRCNTDEEQKVSNLRKECSAKNYQFNYDEKRCYTDEEQKAYLNKKAEEERKRQEEQRKTEEQKKQEEETKQSQPTTNSTTTYPSGVSSTDELEPGEVKSLCNRTIKSSGLPEIKSITNGYPMGYPEEIFVLVGTTKDGQQVQCQINWQTWAVKSIRLNGALVYGN